MLRALIAITIAAHPKLLGVGVLFNASLVAWSSAEASDPQTLKVALIGGLALVLSAALPALISSLRKGGTDPTLKALIDSNNQRRREYADLAKEHAKCDERIDKLEAMLWENGINPNTGNKIHPEPQT